MYMAVQNIATKVVLPNCSIDISIISRNSDAGPNVYAAKVVALLDLQKQLALLTYR
jgi:hypothetical protein